MQNADNVFQEVREILGVGASMAPQVAASITLQSFLDKGVETWVSALRGTDLQIPWSAEELRLYGSYSTLEEGQVGYRVDASGSRFQKWQDDWIVLGEISGDPIIGIAE